MVVRLTMPDEDSFILDLIESSADDFPRPLIQSINTFLIPALSFADLLPLLTGWSPSRGQDILFLFRPLPVSKRALDELIGCGTVDWFVFSDQGEGRVAGQQGNTRLLLAGFKI